MFGRTMDKFVYLVHDYINYFPHLFNGVINPLSYDLIIINFKCMISSTFLFKTKKVLDIIKHTMYTVYIIYKQLSVKLMLIRVFKLLSKNDLLENMKGRCLNVLIHVSPNNPKPMYEQIVDEIQRLIAMRVLEPDELLPSIRQLSKELTTSAITIRRAYQELEGSGFIYTRAGRGSFVAQLSEDDIMAWKMKQVQEPL